MVLQKKCNKCKFVGHLDYFIKSKRYKYGVRPYCKMCHHRDQRIKRGQELIEWTPKLKKEKIKKEKVIKQLNITPEAIMILINNGFARNREEALQYIQ